MADLGMTFNVNDAPERDDFSPVPPGQYVGMVVASDKKQTSSGGEMFVLEIDIQGGEYAGRKIFENLNIVNNNQKAVDIAFRILGEIGKAVGKASLKNTTELHNKRFLMDVVVEPAKPYIKDGVEHPGKPKNKVKKYLPVNGATSGETATPASIVAEGKSADSTPPWKRGKA